MPKSPTFGNALVNAETNAATALLNGGYLRIFDGGKPANPDIATSTQVLLAELRWANPAFADSVGGLASSHAITAATALAGGQATWFRALQADGVTGVFDGTVGSTADFDLVIDSTNIQIGAQVSVGAFSYSNPKQG